MQQNQNQRSGLLDAIQVVLHGIGALDWLIDGKMWLIGQFLGIYDHIDRWVFQ